MRKLFMMIGAPASGKDYWIRQHNLEDYAISPDILRMQFTTPKHVLRPADSFDNQNVTTSISSSADRDVWQAVQASINDHVKNGEFAVVNSTNLFRGAFKMYKMARKDYHYKIYVIDTMPQWIRRTKNKAEIINRLTENDSHRDPRKQVGEYVIKKYVDRYFQNLDKNGRPILPDYVHYIDSEDNDTIDSLLDWQSTDMSKFKRIKVVGDVHGDYDALQQVFADHQKGDAYIFVGDYLDRGTKSPAVFKFVTQTLGGSNLFFIKGNHETGWEKFAVHGKPSGQFSYDSLPQLRAIYDDEALKQIITKFAKNWLDYVKFDFNGKTYYVSHAGVEPFMTKLPGETLDEGLFVEGIGPHQNPYARDIDQVWHDTMPDNLVNIHGHRNSFNRFDLGNAFNLTADDKFRWLVIDNAGIHPHEIDRIDVHSFVQDLVNADHVNQHPVEDGIVANNFDRTAFRKGIWDEMTTKARGLFTRGDDIVGRGFNKFFQIGQRPDATLDSLQFPVTVEKKWNGFLAVTFWDQDTNKLRIYSKGGYPKMTAEAQRILHATGWEQKLVDYFTADASNQDTTVLFEVIDPVNDPHIVKYDQAQAHPLAIIDNTKQGTVDNLYAGDAERAKWPKSRQQLAATIEDNTYFATAENLAQLQDIIKRFEMQHPTDEGLVFYAPNKMLKYKSKFYLKAKELRGMLERGTYRKTRYYYGAKLWAQYCAQHHIKHFSPDLALKLYDLEKKGELNEGGESHAWSRYQPLVDI